MNTLVIWVINRLVILRKLYILHVNLMIEYRMHCASVVNNTSTKFSSKLGGGGGGGEGRGVLCLISKERSITLYENLMHA